MFLQLMTDYAFHCPSLYAAKRLSLSNEVRFCEFNHVPDHLSHGKVRPLSAFIHLFICSAVCSIDKVRHTVDVPYLYGSVPSFELERRADTTACGG
jgi:hypothetical protein